MRNVRLFEDIMKYIGVSEEMIDYYLQNILEDLDDNLDNINDIDVGNIICRLLEENIQLYFDSSRNELIL